MAEPRNVQILRDSEQCPVLPIVEGPGIAKAVVWPGAGAHLRSMHRISLGAGSCTVRLQHPMEAVYFLMSGAAIATDPDSGETASMVTGSMALVEPGTPYMFVAGAEGAELVGGPCPADPAMYRHVEQA